MARFGMPQNRSNFDLFGPDKEHFYCFRAEVIGTLRAAPQRLSCHGHPGHDRARAEPALSLPKGCSWHHSTQSRAIAGLRPRRLGSYGRHGDPYPPPRPPRDTLPRYVYRWTAPKTLTNADDVAGDR